MLPILVGLFVI